MKRSYFTLIALATFLVSLTLPALAQDKKAAASKTNTQLAAKDKKDVARIKALTQKIAKEKVALKRGQAALAKANTEIKKMETALKRRRKRRDKIKAGCILRKGKIAAYRHRVRACRRKPNRR